MSDLSSLAKAKYLLVDKNKVINKKVLVDLGEKPYSLKDEQLSSWLALQPSTEEREVILCQIG
jgi:hypothetical protein